MGEGDKKGIKYLIFGAVSEDKLDIYYGFPLLPDSKMPAYLKGAISTESKPAPDRLHYYFDYLGTKDSSIAQDALREFTRENRKDIIAAAKKFPADRILKALEDRNIPPALLNVYGSLLGYIGDPKHAGVLKKILADPENLSTSGMESVLEGYVLLAPEAGWRYLRDLLGNTNEPFLTRYAGLRAVRLLWEFNPDLVGKDKLVTELTMLLDQPDIADLAIEDLRHWKRWEPLEKILALYSKKSHHIAIIKRVIIRYSICAAAEHKEAEAFVAERVKDEPEMVADCQELLALEAAGK